MWNPTGTFDLYTEDRLQYRYYPVTSNNLTFRVKARKDAHIILTATPYDSVPCYEIFFGGWENTKSVIRKNLQKPDVCEVATPNILNENQYRGFWIRWENGSILAGIQGDVYPTLRYQDNPAFSVQFFGVCTGWGATGHWIIDQSPVAANPSSFYHPQPPYAPGSVQPPVYQPPVYQAPCSALYSSVAYVQPVNTQKWVQASFGSVPPNAVVGGIDCSGETIYIARASHEGATIPGKLIVSHRAAYVAWGGKENAKNYYEVLCDCTPRWIPATGGNIPAGAFPGGRSESGEMLFIGKASHGGATTPGKIQPSHGVCYIPFGGEEIAKRIYDVLVV